MLVLDYIYFLLSMGVGLFITLRDYDKVDDTVTLLFRIVGFILLMGGIFHLLSVPFTIFTDVSATT